MLMLAVLNVCASCVLHCVLLTGAGGLGDTTLHHVYSDSAGTGELTASMKPGSAAAAAASGPGLRAGSRRRSSVGRGRARPSLATEVIPEETLTPQPPAAGAAAAAAADGDDDNAAHDEFEFDMGRGGTMTRAAAPSPAQLQEEQQDATGSLEAAAAAAAAGTPAHMGAAGADTTQDMDMDISMGLGGATPGLLGNSHMTPVQHGWRQQQQTPMQQQQQQHFEMVPESPEASAAGPADDGMDADENAPPASPGASPAAGAAAGEVQAQACRSVRMQHAQPPACSLQRHVKFAAVALVRLFSAQPVINCFTSLYCRSSCRWHCRLQSVKTRRNWCWPR